MPDTVLAFDFGEKRIGVAVGNTEVGIAHPLETITAESNAARFTAIAAIIQEWRPSRLVVGLPAHLDGAEHELTRLARKFAKRLHARFNLPVMLIDERLSSAAASLLLRETGLVGRRQKAILDKVAAQHILQQYLDSTHATT